MDTDLLTNRVGVCHHPLDVVAFWSSLQHELLDLHLQLGVRLLQRAHLVQVVGQTVVQALHGLLVAGADTEAIEGEAQHVDAVAHREGARQRQRADGGKIGDGGFGADAASAVPHGDVGEGELTHRAHREGGGHGVHCTDRHQLQVMKLQASVFMHILCQRERLKHHI